MDPNLFSIFSTLFFVVDPIGLTPFFIGYLSPYEKQQRKRIIIRAHLIAILISLSFILLGDVIVMFLGVSPASFIIAGGVLLFLISIDMLYARPVGPRTANKGNPKDGDPAVYPLAIPMLSGPGNVAALLMFTTHAEPGWMARGSIALISVGVFFISSLILLSGVSLIKFLGETGISVMHRMMGLILSALSVQFILNGLKSAGILG